MLYIGKGWYPDSPKADEDKITKATISKKKISIDYNYHGKELYIKLNSQDEIYYTGEYGEFNNKKGTCGFTLYENKSGYFLYGGYSSPEDGSGIWCIELTPSIGKPKPQTVEKFKFKAMKHRERVLRKENRKLSDYEDFINKDYDVIK